MVTQSVRVATRRPAIFFVRPILLAIAIAQAARLTVFMIDPSQTWASTLPYEDFFLHHSCFSAYFEAARLVRVIPNIYDPRVYFGREIGPFQVDLFLYPPPFLLLPRAALALTGSFFVLRTAWFVVEGLLVVWATLALGRWIGGREGRSATLLAPLVWAALPTLLTLQIGNFQVAAVALSVLAMIAFDRGRHLAGGAMLGFATVSKVFPGILIVALLARRQWRAAAFTAAASGIYVVLSYAVLGAAPFDAFLHYHLPRVSSGDAFPFLKGFPPAVAVSHSVYCTVLKLGLLGVPGMTGGLASTVAWGYSIVVLAAAVVASRRASDDRNGRALVWVGLLSLASLRSPFVPQEYALFAPLWLVTLGAARPSTGAARLALLAAAYLALNLVVPVDVEWPLRVLVVVAAIPQIVNLVVTTMSLRRASCATPA
jgi:hypothetical protein